MKKRFTGIKSKMFGTTIETPCIYSMQKAILLITILTAISFLPPFVKAIEFSFEAPSSIDIDEEFEVSINSNENVNEEYDVKIFVHESKEYEIPRSTYISEIFDEEKDKWSDPWFYLKESYPNEGTYEIRVTESEGDQILCVRLRKSENNEDGKFDEKCEEIEVGESNDKDEDEDEDDEEKESDLVYYSNTQEQKVEPKIEPEQLSFVEEEIKLSAPKKQTAREIRAPQSKKKEYLLYSFFGFLFILVILLALGKL